MTTYGRTRLRRIAKLAGKIFCLAVVPALLLLQACGGGAAPNPTLVSIQISPANSLVLLASTRQLTATGVYNDGTKQDLTTQVTWSSCAFSTTSNVPSTCPSPKGMNSVSIDANGIATGMTLGTSSILATLGPVAGATVLTVSTNGYSANTVGILAVPYRSTEVDAAYVPISQFQNEQGVYTVQEVNLEADSFSSVLPLPTAEIGSIPMPTGFTPNATVANQGSLQVAVISYTSNEVQVIDASNDPADLASNTIIATYTAPIAPTQTVTFTTTVNGAANSVKTCAICAAVVDPTTGKLIMSTAQGYYSMDLSTGSFAPLPFVSTAFPAANFVLNPQTAPANPIGPYIMSPTFGQDPNLAAEVQLLSLPSDGSPGNVTTAASGPTFGATAPNVAVDLFTNIAVVADGNLVSGKSPTQAFVPLNNIRTSSTTWTTNPAPTLETLKGGCNVAGKITPLPLPMLALAIQPLATAQNHLLFSSEPSGNCVGVEILPPDTPQYGEGKMPDIPDSPPLLGGAFENGSDLSAITTYAAVSNKKSYGLLVDANQKWIARVDLGSSTAALGPFPGGGTINFILVSTGSNLLYLPTVGTVSVSPRSADFGSQKVGVSSLPLNFAVNNVSTTTPVSISAVTIQGANAGDFTQSNNCNVVVLPQGGTGIPPQGSCTISVIFTPEATGAETAAISISITNNGGVSPLTVSLSGTGSGTRR